MLKDAKERYLVLEDGQIFKGLAFGGDCSCIGELVFTTGLNGYIETLTDPSYCGQIVLQTFPMIGNYGIIKDDFEGECFLKGYVVREWCKNPSNFRVNENIDQFLKEKRIPAIYGIDTRQVTKIIREKGVMNAIITDEIPTDLTEIKNYKIVNALKEVSCKEKINVKSQNENKYKVALIDYGAKRNIVRELVKRNCNITIFPFDVSYKEIQEYNPDGIMLSNGPGDPAENVFQIEQIKKLVGKYKIFGICLGHQLLALANGAKTEKLKYGHRGSNQPVKDTLGTRTYITSQNHGYAVIKDSVKNGTISFENANDNSCEGIEYKDLNAFSVQFHPEACSGPQDTSFLFDKFIALMEKK